MVNFFVNDGADFGRRKTLDFGVDGGKVFVGEEGENFFFLAFIKDGVSFVLKITAGFVPVAKKEEKDKERNKIKKVVLKKHKDFLEGGGEGKDSFFKTNDDGEAFARIEGFWRLKGKLTGGVLGN